MRYRNRKHQLMRLIGNNAVNFFKVDIFDAQGWIDGGAVNRWAPRKGNTRKGGKILVDSGRGRQSITMTKITVESVTIESGADYMRYHNEGTMKMPKRQFMGESKTLNKQSLEIIKKFLGSTI